MNTVASSLAQNLAQKLANLILLTVGSFTINILTTLEPVQAMTLYNQWNYTFDTYNDSTGFNREGNGAFEIYGAAYKVAGNTGYFAINSNVNLTTGVYSNIASDRRIDFGDMLLNFTGKSLADANGELFGIRFAPGNDSLAPTLGVYRDVTARSVTGENSGYGSLMSYNLAVLSYGVTPSIGALLYDDDYLDPQKSTLNSIKDGTKIGEINLIYDVDNLDLEFDFFGTKIGTHTFAFSFDATLFPSNPGIYLFGMECNNDLVAGYYDVPEVPTPAAILPAVLGVWGAAVRRKKVGARRSPMD